MEKSVKIKGRTLTFHLRNDGDEAIFHEILVDRQYRVCEETIASATEAIVDIGGHIGCFALYAHALNSRVPIYSYEPHPGNFEVLKKNLRQNHAKNVVAKQVAVGGKVGEVTLHLSLEDLNHSTICPLEPTGAGVKVQQKTLEQIFSKNDINVCDLLKVDCEGAEFEILYTAPAPILKRVQHLAVEYHEWAPGHKGRDLENFLKKSGFRAQHFPNSKVPLMGTLVAWR